MRATVMYQAGDVRVETMPRRGQPQRRDNRAALLAVLTQLLPFIGKPRTLNGLAAINEITPPERKQQ